MTSLFTELRRRNVFRVAMAYVVVAWLLAQVADLGLENFGAPDWVVKTLLLLLILGLPIAVFFAWAFELTPDGIRREKDIDREELAGERKSGRFNIVIMGLLAVALAYFVYESRFSKDPSTRDQAAQVVGAEANSIAVLPFATFGSNEADGYLSDGLAETMLNQLAQIDGLQVAARTSAFKFKNTNEDIRIIGEQLGVATVLEGSVQRSGKRIRITAQLINVADGFHMYSETFERELDDIFAVQDEIAQAVVTALQVEFLGTSPKSNPDIGAYETLARLRARLRTSAAEEMNSIVDALNTLTEQYPDYADAYATLSEAYRLFGSGAGLIPEDILAKAIDAGRKAVELAPETPAGYVSLGSALLYRGLFTEAAPIVAKALELQPGNADVMAMQGTLLTLGNRFSDALEMTAGAMLRDPLNANTRSSLAHRHAALGQVDQSMEVLDLGLELEPGDLSLLITKASILRESDRLGEALLAIEDVLRLDPNNIQMLQTRFYLPYIAGDLDGALRALERAETVSPERLYDERALYCYATGDTQCWHAATTRMLATRNRFFVQTWQARMLYEGGLIDDAIAALLPVVAYFDETGDWYGNSQTRTNLAAVYGLKGETGLRDQALDPVVEAFETAVNNGYGDWHLYFDMAAVQAVLGDAQATMQYLEQAYARGFRSLDEITYHIAFDALRDQPKMKSFVQRIREESALQLRRALADQP